MDKQRFLTTTVSFLEGNLLPGLRAQYGNMADFVLGGFLALNSHNIYNKYEPILKELGLADDCGNIKVDILEKFVQGGFEKVPEISFSPRQILGLKFDNPLINKFVDGQITFTKEEITEFIQLLKSQQ